MNEVAIEACVAKLQSIGEFRNENHPRLWWIIDNASFKAVRNELHLTCVTIFEQIGIDVLGVKKLYGRKWSTAFRDIANIHGSKYFVWGTYKNCFFVSL